MNSEVSEASIDGILRLRKLQRCFEFGKSAIPRNIKHRTVFDLAKVAVLSLETLQLD